ncbi:MAG: hypothetical protein LCH53_04440 [Bacteroidetes bacterium]|nr:hypothetical protein [Bacteroidota bacterium]
MPNPLVLNPAADAELGGFLDSLWEAVKPIARNLPVVGSAVRTTDDYLTAQNQAKRAATSSGGSVSLPTPYAAPVPAPAVDVNATVQAALAQQQAQFQQLLEAQQAAQTPPAATATILGMPKNTAFLMGGLAAAVLYASRR